MINTLRCFTYNLLYTTYENIHKTFLYGHQPSLLLFGLIISDIHFQITVRMQGSVCTNDHDHVLDFVSQFAHIPLKVLMNVLRFTLTNLLSKVYCS